MKQVQTQDGTGSTQSKTVPVHNPQPPQGSTSPSTDKKATMTPSIQGVKNESGGAPSPNLTPCSGSHGGSVDTTPRTREGPYVSDTPTIPNK